LVDYLVIEMNQIGTSHNHFVVSHEATVKIARSAHRVETSSQRLSKNYEIYDPMIQSTAAGRKRFEVNPIGCAKDDELIFGT